MPALTLHLDDQAGIECTSVIIVPEIAVQEPGYIKMLSAGAAANAKHEFQALAQMAYYQYQDGEVDCRSVQDIIRCNHHSGSEELTAGLVIGRSSEGQLVVAAQQGLNPKKLLEAAHRFTTRWVRLDI